MATHITKTAKQFQQKPNDIIYTPLKVAKIMIDMCDIKPTDIVLDPCYGGGVFYDNLPECNKKWCEIEKEKDFFDFNEECDIIIGNPPYSLWTKWLEHSIKLNPKKICYIFGNMNFTAKRIKMMEGNKYFITKIIFLKVGWWFSQSILVLFEKLDEKPLCDISFVSPVIKCDICNKFCKKKANVNECCSKIKY
jgi:hypothetical protein